MNRRTQVAGDLIHDRGRGPEVVGTRITVYNLLPHFLDATATEAYICEMYELTPEQVAAARAYVLNNPEAVMAEHLRIEARMTAGNPPEVVELAKQTHAAFLSFKEWLAERQRAGTQDHSAESTSENGRTASSCFPTFREWLTERKSRAAGGP
jgi:uncharacterized protein (DUF433 family)